MSDKPVVLGFHALLELLSLIAVGYWGWIAHDGAERWVWAIAVPLLLGTVWAVFRAREDDGEPIIEVSGTVRLVLELAILGLSGALLFAAGQQGWALVFLGLTALDYALQYDRVGRLLGVR